MIEVLCDRLDLRKSQLELLSGETSQQKRFLGFGAVTNLLCGEAAENAGHLVEAEAEYAEIIQLEPRNPWGFMKRGLLREKLGQRKRAQEDLAEVLNLAPGNPEAEELLGIWKAQ